MSRAALWTPALAALVVLAPRQAGADPARFELRWTAPEGCPQAADVREHVEKLLGARAPEERRFTGEGTVVQGSDSGDADRWRVRLVSIEEGEPRERSLDGGSCAEVTDAAALIVALAIDPAAGATPEAPAPEARAEAGPAAARPALRPGADRTAPPKPAPTARQAFTARAAATFDVGSLPAPALGIDVGAGVAFGRLRIEAAGAYFPSREATVPSRATAADIALVAGRLRLCYLPVGGEVEIGACAGFEGGALLGEGRNVNAPEDNASLWLAPDAGLLGLFPVVRHVSVVGALEAAIPLNREHFVIDDQELHQAARVVGRALVGLETRFP